MSERENLKVLAFVGLTGSGKTRAVKYMTDKGFPKVYFGGVMLDEMTKAGVPWGEDNEKTFRLKLREEKGQDFIAERIIEQIHHLVQAGQHRIIADGIYTWDEYKAMRHAFPGELTVVACVAPRHVRYHRLTQRTDDRPQTEAISAQRDQNEIETMQKGGPIAMADFYIINDGEIEDFYQKIDDICEQVKF
jgi:dephospho-CoA kinase